MGEDLIRRSDVLSVLEKVFGQYGISFGSSAGGFGSAVPEAVQSIPTDAYAKGYRNEEPGQKENIMKVKDLIPLLNCRIRLYDYVTGEDSEEDFPNRYDVVPACEPEDIPDELYGLEVVGILSSGIDRLDIRVNCGGELYDKGRT